MRLRELFFGMLFSVLTICITALSCYAAEAEQCGKNAYWILDNDGVFTLSGNGKMWDLPIGYQKIQLSDGKWTAVEIYNYVSSYRIVQMSDGREAVVCTDDNVIWHEIMDQDGNCSIVSVRIDPDESPSEITYESVVLSDGSIATVQTGEILPGIRETSWCEVTMSNGKSAVITEPYYWQEVTFDDDTVMMVKLAPWSDSTIKKVVIDSGITKIDESLLIKKEDVTAYTVSENNTVYSSDECGVLYNKDKTCLIKFPAASELTSYVIPESVKEIDINAFFGCTNLESVTMSANVEKIGICAFSKCSSLKSIIIPDSVKIIEDYAFKGCTSLENVDGMNGVVSAGCEVFIDTPFFNNYFDGMFYVGKVAYEYIGEMPENSSLVIKPGTETIGESFCYYPENIVSVILPEGLKTIEKFAFAGCENLSSIDLPESLEAISEGAFQGSGITDITIPGNTTIEASAFEYCEKLKYVVMEEGVTTIPERAFAGCTSLTNVSLAQSLETIGEYAFSETGLVSVIIPDSIKKIDCSAFAWCEKLEHVFGMSGVEKACCKIFDETPYYSNLPDGMFYIGRVASEYIGEMSENAVITIKDGTQTLASRLFSGAETLEEIILPDGLLNIEQGVFEGCVSLKNIVLPNTLKTIGDYAFSFSGISEIEIPGGVEILLPNTFEGCEGLQKVILNNGLTEIGDCAFVNCLGLKTIKLPETLNEIGWKAFFESGLTGIEIPEGVEIIDDGAFCCCPDLEIVVMKEGLTEIGHGVFSNCPKLINVSLPVSLSKIGESVFSASGVVNMTIPGNIEAIPLGMFSECDNLQSVVISDGIKEIGECAFSECESLKSVVIPDSVEIIGESAFAYSGIAAISLPNNLKELGYGTFMGCGLVSVTIPGTVEEFGYEAFQECKSLKSVVLESGITDIPASAFRDCTKLRDVVFPDTLVNIDYEAFYGCAIENGDFPDTIRRVSDSAFEETPWYNNAFPGVQGAVYLDNVLCGVRDPIGSLTALHIKEGTVTTLDSISYTVEQLKEITFPESMKCIGDYAFEEWENVEQVTIPETIEQIGTFAFYNTKWFKSKPVGLVYHGDMLYSFREPDESKEMMDVEILEGTVRISNEALTHFDGYISSIVVPRTVVHFGENCFGYGTMLKVYKGTYAEKYAEENNIEYISLGDVPREKLIFDMDDDKTITANDVIETVKSAAYAGGDSTTELKNLNELLQYIRSLTK